MKKTLALLLVASLLLAGCTELISSDEDDEVKKIEVNEEIALEEIADFITIDADESFGITMMYDMDPSMMDDGGMLEFDEDSDAMITIEMTEAWSPDGYHSSMVMGLTEDGATMKMTQTFTHVGTTIYTSIGYETIGDICANEDSPEETEACEMQVESIPATQFYSMEAANTHTDLIAAMAEETSDNSDDFDVNGFLELLEAVENYGEFTATDETVDGLQIFDLTFDMVPTPEEALEMCDADNSGGISWDEFIAEDCDDTDPSMTSTDEGLWLGFSSADTDGSEELTVDELPAFITAVTAFYEGGDDDEEMEMPGMKVAFNSAGEIEYFEMQMDEMGDEIVTMKMYVLTEDRVASFFTDLEAGELVALPFELSDSMDGGSDDWDDGGSSAYIDAYLTDNWASSDMDYADPELRVYSGFNDIAGVYFTLYEDYTPITSWAVSTSSFVDMSDTGMGMVYYVPVEDIDYGEGCYMLVATITDMDGYDWQWSREDICFYGDDSGGDDGGDEEYIFYCSNDGEAYAEAMGGILCPEGPGVTPECPNGEDCVCIDVDGTCFDGDDDWGYMTGDDDHGDEFTCDDGETIPMDYVNDGEEDCMGGEDEGYVWTSTYDNCDDSDHGLSSLDCWDAEWDIDGDGVPEDSNSYWNYECEQLADGSWECMTDQINYYDNCAYEDEDYYECWLDEWDTDDDGSYDLGSDGYMDYECEQLADGRWACSHSDDGGGDGMLTPELVLELFDSDGDSMLSWDEFWDSFESGSADDEDALSLIFDENDDDMDGLLSEEELEDFILAVMAYEDDDEPTFICGNGEEIPFMYVNDGGADCADGADEQQYDSDGNEINWFDCMDGTQIWISEVNDGYEDCQDGEDEMPDMDDDHDGHDHDDHGDEDMVCYDMSTHTVDHTIDNEADCEAAGYMWTEDQSDDHDHGDHGDDSDEIVMYITSDMDFHFEGDMSDYKIELATCDEDYDWDTGESTKTCTTVMAVAIADAGADSDIVFHDADSSGTISVGDMIHIGETSEEWNTVRLYSVSADAYSDENPMLTVPGFTGLVGMLALLGAAFIRRNE